MSDLRDKVGARMERYCWTATDTVNPAADDVIALIRERLLAPENIERVTQEIHARNMAAHGMSGPAYAFKTMTPKAQRSLIAERRELIQHAIDVAMGGN